MLLWNSTCSPRVRTTVPTDSHVPTCVPLLAGPYFFLANLLWDQTRKQEALELYRFAAGLDDNSDGLARTYLRSARALNRSDEVIRFLEDRVARFGDKSSQPARILFNAF